MLSPDQHSNLIKSVATWLSALVVVQEEMAPEDAFVRKAVELVQAKECGVGAVGAFARPERGCTCHPSWALPACLECKPCA